MELSTYALESLREDADFVLYRGRRDANPRHIFVLVPSSKHPAQAALERLEHEYALRAKLDSAWAVVPLALVHEIGRAMLVLEDLGGQPLDLLLQRPLELTEVLRISIGLATALGRLHERGIIHRDVKPANVVVDMISNKVWLSGFGIASELPRERQAPDPPETIAGTLAYDESTWKGRPQFAKEGMAQPRALSRACKHRYDYVVVLMAATMARPRQKRFRAAMKALKECAKSPRGQW